MDRAELSRIRDGVLRNVENHATFCDACPGVECRPERFSVIKVSLGWLGIGVKRESNLGRIATLTQLSPARKVRIVEEQIDACPVIRSGKISPEQSSNLLYWISNILRKKHIRSVREVREIENK